MCFCFLFGSFLFGGEKNTQTTSPKKSRDNDVKILFMCIFSLCVVFVRSQFGVFPMFFSGLFRFVRGVFTNLFFFCHFPLSRPFSKTYKEISKRVWETIQFGREQQLRRAQGGVVEELEMSTSGTHKKSRREVNQAGLPSKSCVI